MDPVHLDILELLGRLCAWQDAAEQLLFNEDRRGIFQEDCSVNWSHPLVAAHFSGDISALIQPPNVRRFGAELRVVLHMLNTATLWLHSADSSSIPPEAQELVWNNLLVLLSSAERFAPSNEAGTFNVPLAPPAASGSATTGSAGQSTSGAMGDSSSSKQWCCQHH